MNTVLEPLLTKEQAADLLGVSKSFVDHLVQTRRLSVVKVGDLVRIEPRAIEALIKNGRRPAERTRP